MLRLSLTFVVVAVSIRAFAASDLPGLCEKDLLSFPGPHHENLVKQVCADVKIVDPCKSVDGVPIYHWDKRSKDLRAKNVLVFSLIHGDETLAGTVGRYWMERLADIEPRNNWRVVPVLNPDGVKAKTRTNGRDIDLNRNFPTRDWDRAALTFWKKQTDSNPRRFPGKQAGSEPEVQCALRHIDEFKPDFVVSVHTPLKVLDFDGPRVKPPKFPYLPWKSLGHFPGSIGRYLWFERSTPVLTMELDDQLPSNYKPFEQLQDVIGSLVALERKPAADLPAPTPAAEGAFRSCMAAAYTGQKTFHVTHGTYTSKPAELRLEDIRECQGVALKIRKATKTEFLVEGRVSTRVLTIDQSKKVLQEK